MTLKKLIFNDCSLKERLGILMDKETIKIGGMTCGACAQRIERTNCENAIKESNRSS